MNWLQELRERRVPQFVISYIVGGFGLMQFLEFLEGRMEMSPHLVNLVGLALLLLLPSIVVLAWSLGRPGDDTLGRTQKVAIPANLLAAAVLLFVVFQGKELGAVTRTIEVEDENGQVTERVVPKSEFRKRLILFFPESPLAESEPWIRETATLLLAADVSQDLFLDVAMPANLANAMRDAGYADGHGLPRARMRKLAADGHYSHYCTGSIDREGEVWVLGLELHATETGRRESLREYRGADLFELVDQATVALREDLGVPASHLEKATDLPVVELTSSDLDAVRSHAAAISRVTLHNDWEGAAPFLEDAVERDPGYALAQFLLFGVYQTVGRAEESNAAMDAAMANLFRVTERTSYLIKAQYYFNIEQDMDKALAVMEMWSRIYPQDITVHSQLALYHYIRQDLTAAVASYETILEIDPTQYHHLEDIADIYRQLGELDKAEASLKRYIELFPARAEGYDDLSEFYAEVGRLDESRETLEQAMLLEPGDQSLRLQRIQLDLKLGEYDRVATELAAELPRAETPRDRARIHAARMALGLAQGQGDVVHAALDSFYANMSLVQNPLQLDIVYSMMLPGLSMVGRSQQTIAELDAAAARIPAPFGDLTGMARAWALTDLGQAEAARAELAKAAQVVDTYQFETFRSSLSLVEGMIARLEKNHDEAARLLRLAIEQAPRMDPNLHVELAGALREAGDLKGAARAIAEGLKLHPAHPEAHLELARIEVARGSNDAAAEHLETVLGVWKEAADDYLPAAEARQIARRLRESP